MGEEFVTRVPKEHIYASRLIAAQGLAQKIMTEIGHRRDGKNRVLTLSGGKKSIPITREMVEEWKGILSRLVNAIPEGSEFRVQAEEELARIYADDKPVTQEGASQLRRLWDAGAEE